jgi:protoheme IX farnesyltransferase
MYAVVRQIGSVFKLRIGVAISFSALAGLAITPGPLPGAWQIVVLALAVLISAASAGAYNQYVERDLDTLMDRTRDRPFASGAYQASWLWLATICGLLVIAVAAAWLALNAWVALYTFLGAFVYGIVYTVWLKRRTWMNIVWGGLAGSFAVLAGAASVDPGLPINAIILAVVLFLWTPPHFWSLATALHKDYEQAGVPMLPVVVGDARAAKAILVSAVALVGASILPVFFGMGWIYLAGAVTGGGYFIHKSIKLVRNPGPSAAMTNFLASLVQLTLLLVGAIIDGWILR